MNEVSRRVVSQTVSFRDAESDHTFTLETLTPMQGQDAEGKVHYSQGKELRMEVTFEEAMSFHAALGRCLESMVDYLDNE